MQVMFILSESKKLTNLPYLPVQLEVKCQLKLIKIGKRTFWQRTTHYFYWRIFPCQQVFNQLTHWLVFNKPRSTNKLMHQSLLTSSILLPKYQLLQQNKTLQQSHSNKSTIHGNIALKVLCTIRSCHYCSTDDICPIDTPAAPQCQPHTFTSLLCIRFPL